MKFLLPTALATLFLAPFALAQSTPGPNLESGTTAAPAGAATYAMAHRLFSIGMANRDALAVLSAARLVASVELTKGSDIRKSTEDASTSGAADTATAPFDVGQMVSAAKALAGEDETLLGLIELVGSDAPHGHTGMATRRTSDLSPGARDKWELPLHGGSYAEIAVVGGEEGGLRFQVADENGIVVCQHTSGSDPAVCGFVPAWNGYFFVTVQNTGERPDHYYLLTN